METFYTVLTYSVGRDRRIHPDQPREAKSAEHARAMAEALSHTKIGVIAFAKSGDFDLDEWADPVILYRAGDFPPEERDAIDLSV